MVGERSGGVEWVAAEPELLAGVVGEVLRLLPPVGGTDRFVTRRTTLGGHVVEAGQRVVVDANRDPEVFVEPGVFEPRREPVRHLSFGRGVHFCLGAHLARMEAEIALGALVERFSGTWSRCGGCRSDLTWWS
ncbi:cytochrome P450 [Umezawaea sp. NPDC059074]|uniref:cytochrome P450 n=1 Tax=Umezawaea sp. NPDC059074 TaxID=3346716 RepID=UPI0036C4E898